VHGLAAVDLNWHRSDRICLLVEVLCPGTRSSLSKPTLLPLSPISAGQLTVLLQDGRYFSFTLVLKKKNNTPKQNKLEEISFLLEEGSAITEPLDLPNTMVEPLTDGRFPQTFGGWLPSAAPREGHKAIPRQPAGSPKALAAGGCSWSTPREERRARRGNASGNPTARPGASQCSQGTEY